MVTLTDTRLLSDSLSSQASSQIYYNTWENIPTRDHNYPAPFIFMVSLSVDKPISSFWLRTLLSGQSPQRLQLLLLFFKCLNPCELSPNLPSGQQSLCCPQNTDPIKHLGQRAGTTTSSCPGDRQDVELT